jgi:GAF domain-containing protein
MSTSHHARALDAAAELGQIDLASNSLEQVLDTIARIAKRTVPGAAEVSFTLIDRDKAWTAAFTGQLALDLDERQYEIGHGPCVDSAQGGTVIHIRDMASETRWPAYTPAAVAAGANASLSVGVPVQDALLAALNTYATKPHAFDDDAVDVAKSFARYAAVAIGNATRYASISATAAQMQEAMESRAVIEQAKGMLMAVHRCTPDDAFDMLVRASQSANRKLRDIAAAMVAGVVDGSPGQT